jgi:hypothetical protein
VASHPQNFAGFALRQNGISLRVGHGPGKV